MGKEEGRVAYTYIYKQQYKRRHCVVYLSKSTSSTQEDRSLYNWKIVDGT